MAVTSEHPLAVIICTYNVKDKLLENVASCLAQETSVPFEILVVDSGSTDGTLEAVKEKFPQVKTHDCRANVGCAIARNIGMKLYPQSDVLLLDSDLVLEKNAIEEFSKYVAEGGGASLWASLLGRWQCPVHLLSQAQFDFAGWKFFLLWQVLTGFPSRKT